MRINIKFFEHQRLGSIKAAKEIAKTIKKKQSLNKNCVLGLATGSSPIDTYSNLVRIHKEEGLSFKNVITFNLDEYLEMDPNSIHSYHYFMHEHLFNHIDIKKENIHIPKGNLRESEIQKHCIQYEKKIETAGGIDLQLLGIGRNGHIGFNEPGSLESSITRKVSLIDSISLIFSALTSDIPEKTYFSFSDLYSDLIPKEFRKVCVIIILVHIFLES